MNTTKIYSAIAAVVLIQALSCSAHTRSDSENIEDAETQETMEIESLGTPAVNPVFEIREIDDEIFDRIKGKSYKDNCNVPLDQLRYLTIAHYDGEGNVKQGELICNAMIAEDLLEIFQNLYAAEYPIERMELIDEYEADDRKSMQANNTSCFNFRKVAGSTKLSKHATGLAIDINPLYNPYVKGNYVSPEEGKPYADRSKEFEYKIDTDDLCYKEFIAHGFTWGGAWNSLKDYQHFEK